MGLSCHWHLVVSQSCKKRFFESCAVRCSDAVPYGAVYRSHSGMTAPESLPPDVPLPAVSANLTPPRGSVVQRSHRNPGAGSIPLCGKGLSQSQISVQTLLRCPYGPSVQMHALTSACTLKVPNISPYKRFPSKGIKKNLTDSHIIVTEKKILDTLV